jgi:hypothetical protein
MSLDVVGEQHDHATVLNKDATERRLGLGVHLNSRSPPTVHASKRAAPTLVPHYRSARKRRSHVHPNDAQRAAVHGLSARAESARYFGDQRVGVCEQRFLGAHGR